MVRVALIVIGFLLGFLVVLGIGVTIINVAYPPKPTLLGFFDAVWKIAIAAPVALVGGVGTAVWAGHRATPLQQHLDAKRMERKVQELPD